MASLITHKVDNFCCKQNVTDPRNNAKREMEKRPCKENPADFASKETRVQDLIKNSLLWKESDFLHGETIKCPPQLEYKNNALLKVHQQKFTER